MSDDIVSPTGTDRPNELFTALYSELHRLAEYNLRRSGGALTLGATTLVHEAYINVSRHQGGFADRAHFLAYASRAMRTLVIDYARRRQATKRGRHLEITLSGDEPPTAEAERTAGELQELSDALDTLSTLQPGLAELVDLHFFCGFTFAEIADARGISTRTVHRDWRKARLLLQHVLLSDSEGPSAIDGYAE